MIKLPQIVLDNFQWTDTPEKKNRDEIQLGDYVTLNSGGPIMIVDCLSEHTAFCIWYDFKSSIAMSNFDSFPVACLTKVGQKD